MNNGSKYDDDWHNAWWFNNHHQRPNGASGAPCTRHTFLKATKQKNPYPIVNDSRAIKVTY